MLINLHISLITKLFFRYFDRHSDKIVTYSELLLDIINFSKSVRQLFLSSESFMRLASKLIRVISIVVSNAVNFLVNEN